MAMLEPGMFSGLGAVALWAYLRYPRVRPASLLRAAVHVAVSFIGFMLLPTALHFLLPLAEAHALRVAVALALLFPALTYVLLSWVCLIGRILQEFDRGPRGGHPAATEH
jgi:hypothetical protein